MIDAPGIELLVEPAAVVDHRGSASRRASSADRPASGERCAKLGVTLRPARIRVDVRTSGACRPRRRNSALPGRRPGGPRLAGVPFRVSSTSSRGGRGAGAVRESACTASSTAGSDRRWRQPERRPTSPPPGSPAVSGGVVDPDRAAPGESGLHGPDESRAFASLPPIAQDRHRLALPPGPSGDPPRGRSSAIWRPLGPALGELQGLVGACFCAGSRVGSTPRLTPHRSSPSCGSLGFVGVRPELVGPDALRVLLARRASTHPHRSTDCASNSPLTRRPSS